MKMLHQCILLISESSLYMYMYVDYASLWLLKSLSSSASISGSLSLFLMSKTEIASGRVFLLSAF